MAEAILIFGHCILQIVLEASVSFFLPKVPKTVSRSSRDVVFTFDRLPKGLSTSFRGVCNGKLKSLYSFSDRVSYLSLVKVEFETV